MKKTTIKKIIILALFLTCFSFAVPILAADTIKQLEVKYPKLPQGVEIPDDLNKVTLPNYIKYVYVFIVVISGLIALGVIVYGGLRYISSAGNPAAINDAKDHIFSAILGLIIVAASWIILNTINPQLTNLDLNAPPTVATALYPGAWLCREDVGSSFTLAFELTKLIQDPKNSKTPNESNKTDLKKEMDKITEKCYNVITSGDIISDSKNEKRNFNDNVKLVVVVPYLDQEYYKSNNTDKNYHYGAILYEDSKYQGKANLFFEEGNGTEQIASFNVSVSASSIRTFQFIKPSSDDNVIAYELPNYNRDDSSKSKWEHSSISYGANLSENNFGSRQEVGSVAIEPSDKLFVVFFKSALNQLPGGGGWGFDNKTELDIITASDANLYDNIMGRWCNSYYLGGLAGTFPCPSAMGIVTAAFY